MENPIIIKSDSQDSLFKEINNKEGTEFDDFFQNNFQANKNYILPTNYDEKFKFYINKLNDIELFFKQNNNFDHNHDIMIKLTCFLCDINTICQMQHFPPHELEKALKLQAMVLSEMIDRTKNKLVNGN
jgi:hypothetical protein